MREREEQVKDGGQGGRKVADNQQSDTAQCTHRKRKLMLLPLLPLLSSLPLLLLSLLLVQQANQNQNENRKMWNVVNCM